MSLSVIEVRQVRARVDCADQCAPGSPSRQWEPGDEARW